MVIPRNPAAIQHRYNHFINIAHLNLQTNRAMNKPGEMASVKLATGRSARTSHQPRIPWAEDTTPSGHSRSGVDSGCRSPIKCCRFFLFRGCSSSGRALVWQTRGNGFDPRQLHQALFGTMYRTTPRQACLNVLRSFRFHGYT